MAKNGVFTSIEDLKEWFDYTVQKTGTNNWILYHGHIMKSHNSTAKAAEQREGDLSDDESFEILQRFIEAQSKAGGTFTILIPEQNKTGSRTFLSINNNSPSMGGVYGPDYVSKEIEQFKTQFMLQQEIEALRAQMNERQNPLEKIVEQLMESGVVGQIIQGFAQKAMGLPTVNGNGLSDTEYQSANVGGIESSLQRIANVFPNLDIALKKLADFVESNPEMARQLLNQTQQNGE